MPKQPELTPNIRPNGENCGTCRFAATNVLAGGEEDRMLIRCLRFPPQRLGRGPEYNPSGVMVRAHQDTGWPVLTWDDWCGEWVPRDA